MTTRELTIAAAVAASLGLGGAALAQQPTAQQVNPSPMAPGSRAGDAPGMNPGNAAGANAQQVNPSPIPPGSQANQAPALNPQSRQQVQGSPDSTGAVPGMGLPAGRSTDSGRIGGSGANAPSGQPDVARGTAPGATGGGTAPTLGANEGARTSATTGGTTTGGAATGGNQAQGNQAQSTQTGSPQPNQLQNAQTTPPANRDAGASPGGATTGATTPNPSTQGGGSTGDASPPAATTRHTEPRTAAAPVPGANSFTEGQARARMGDAGFNDVQELRLDEQGIWRGRAMRNGSQTGVALDYQGNVVATQ